MSNIRVTTPSFVFGYWRPWNENSNLTESYLNYVKDVSLVKYGADVVGKYVKEASQEQVNAISKLGNKIGSGFDLLSNKLDTVNEELRFLNANTEILVEQQRLSNILLEDIIELLRVPDSEKERQHAIELGIKFFVNAQKDHTLFDDALEQLQKAEALMKQDYFVLHRIGCIHLYVENHLDIKKARDYFIKSAKYSSVESGPDAVRLANALTENTLNKQKRHDEINSFIENLNWETYPELQKINVFDLSYDEDTIFFKIATEGVFDSLFEEAAQIIVQHQQGSTSLLQRKLNLGYNRAGLLIDQLEKAEIVGPFHGSKAREVLVNNVDLLEIKLRKIKRDSKILKTIGQYNPITLSAEELIDEQEDVKKQGLIRSEVMEISSIIENINLKHQYYGTNSLKALASDSYQKAAFCSYILGEFEKAVTYQQEATDLVNSPENLYLLAKYLTRNSQQSEAVENLSAAIDLMPAMALAVFKEIDLLNTPEILKLIEKKNEEINDKVNELIEEWKDIKSKISLDEINHLNLALNSSYDIKVASHNKSKEILKDTVKKIDIQKQEIDETISEFNSKTVIKPTDDLIDNLNKSKDLTLEEMEQIHIELEEKLNNTVVKIGSNYQGGLVFHLDESGKHGLICAENIFESAVWGGDGMKCRTTQKLGSGKNNTTNINKNAGTKTKDSVLFLATGLTVLWFFWGGIKQILLKGDVSIPLLTQDGIYWGFRLGIFAFIIFSVLFIGSKNKTKLTTAAELCLKSTLNGFNDWFLPSIEELELIHKNLYSQGKLENLTEQTCWSSSEYIHDSLSIAEKYANAYCLNFNKTSTDQMFDKRLNKNGVLMVRSF